MKSLDIPISNDSLLSADIIYGMGFNQWQIMKSSSNYFIKYEFVNIKFYCQSTGAVEDTNCTSAVG